MADPVIVACPADVWTKVATNVTSGQIHIKDSKPGMYLQTYRMTGGRGGYLPGYRGHYGYGRLAFPR